MANLVGKTPIFIPSSQASAKADAVVFSKEPVPIDVKPANAEVLNEFYEDEEISER